MTPVVPHIWLDERGVAWIDDTNIKVIEVAAEWRYGRMHPEEMVYQHYGKPDITQVFAALAYYHDHRTEFDLEMERQHLDFTRRWLENLNSPIRQKLRAMGKLP